MEELFRNRLAPALLFLAAWLLLTGDVHPLSISLASAGSLAAVLFSAEALGPRPARDARLPFRPDLLAAYFAVVLLQSYAAGLNLVVRMITGRYRPGLVRIRTRLRSRVGQTLLANTISLIPGTLSLWMADRHIIVHWFDMKTDHGMKAGRLIKQDVERYLERLFG